MIMANMKLVLGNIYTKPETDEETDGVSPDTNCLLYLFDHSRRARA